MAVKLYTVSLTLKILATSELGAKRVFLNEIFTNASFSFDDIKIKERKK